MAGAIGEDGDNASAPASTVPKGSREMRRLIVQIADEPSGTLRGKAAVGAYWAKALALIPDLRFELISILVGVNSIVLYYRGARGRLAAEVFHFGAGPKILKAFAHYDAQRHDTPTTKNPDALRPACGPTTRWNSIPSLIAV